MADYVESIPGQIVLPGRTVGRPATVTWSPELPDFVILEFDDEAVDVVTSVSRDEWYQGTGAPRCDIGKLIYPMQCKDVHWTVMQVQVPGVPIFGWWVQTWRVVDFIAATHQVIPEAWQSTYADIADDERLDERLAAWLAVPRER